MPAMNELRSEVSTSLEKLMTESGAVKACLGHLDAMVAAMLTAVTRGASYAIEYKVNDTWVLAMHHQATAVFDTPDEVELALADARAFPLDRSYRIVMYRPLVVITPAVLTPPATKPVAPMA